MDKETEERINRPIPYQEFPKMLHHPDGRTVIVENERQASAAGGEWLPTPGDALKVKAERDAAEEKRLAAQIAKDVKDDAKDEAKGRKGY
jgi:hypothetical protein